MLPQGWVVLKVEQGTYPWYRPKGKGTAVALGISGRHYAKQQRLAAVYIMPPDYDDGGDDLTHGQAQSPPARLIAAAKNGKLYLWPPSGQAEDWRTMQEDLLKALVKSSEPGRRED